MAKNGASAWKPCASITPGSSAVAAAPSAGRLGPVLRLIALAAPCLLTAGCGRELQVLQYMHYGNEPVVVSITPAPAAACGVNGSKPGAGLTR